VRLADFRTLRIGDLLMFLIVAVIRVDDVEELADLVL